MLALRLPDAEIRWDRNDAKEIPLATVVELLTLLVERYEQAHYAIPEADAVSVVRFLIEHQGLTQRDLTPEFGSESAV